MVTATDPPPPPPPPNLVITVSMARFWNNFHQVRSELKDGKAKYFKFLGAREPWAKTGYPF